MRLPSFSYLFYVKTGKIHQSENINIHMGLGISFHQAKPSIVPATQKGPTSGRLQLSHSETLMCTPQD